MTSKLASAIAVATLGITASLFAQTTPAPKPSICDRACWAARTASSFTENATLNRASIHHTEVASHQDTTGLESSKSMVRGIQNYHMDNNGWVDIGYNFLVDKFGNIFEGRKNSVASKPKGAHDGTNTDSVGVSCMGNFDTQTPPIAQRNSCYDLIAWKLPSGWSPYGSSSYGSKSGVGVVCGHKDAYNVTKSCPGAIFYNNYITANFSGGEARDSVASRRSPQSINNASFVSKSHPSSVVAGSTFSASITMKNNGTKKWHDVTNHKLGSQNPQDNSRWGLTRVAVAGTVDINQNYTFSFTCTAPTTPAAYAFDWQMLEEGVEWFGGSATATITVTAAAANVIVDNNSSGFSASSSWTAASSSTDKYGADYRYRSTAALSDNGTWTGNLPSTKTYNVSAWWPQGANRSATAAYHVVHAGGTTVVTVNQQANGGKWNSLGSWSMNAGNNDVRLSCWTTTGFIVVADAIRWQ